MLNILFWVAVGACLGWYVPQTAQAKWIRAWFVKNFNKVKNKFKI